jgi:sulfonate transport system permease protein
MASSSTIEPTAPVGLPAPAAPGGPTARGARRRSWSRRAAVALSYVVVPIALIVLWDRAVANGWVPSTLVASPEQVVTAMWTLLTDGTLTRNAWVSIQRLLEGFALGSACGIVVGAAVGTSRVMARLLEPTLLTLLPIPAVAWVPLLIVLFGIGELSKILVIGIGSFFTLFLYTAHGIRSTDRKLIEVAYVLEKSRPQLVWRVLLPSALPQILAAARIAMGLSWALLIVAEVVASSSGLGWLIWDARQFSRPADMIVGMIAIGVLGKTSDWLLALLARATTGWQETYGSRP